MGSSFQEPEEEYAEIKKIFCQELGLNPEEITFVPEVMPHKLQGMSTDIYVIDYGGMLPGSDDLIRSIFRDVIRLIEDRPNTLFVIWSQFSMNWYRELVKEESPELVAPNVIFMPHVDLEDEWERIRRWFEE
jgi:hypothetical protein